jgi:outer membrane protein TolC
VARCFLAVLLLAGTGSTLFAQTTVTLAPAQTETAASPEPLVSLDDLLKQALAKNPEILAAQKRYEAARTRPTQESSLPDPTVSFGSRNTGNPVPFTSIGKDPMANAGLAIEQELPFPGKLRLRGEMAQQEAAAAFQDYQAALLRTTSRLKQDYYQLHYTYKAGEILGQNKDLLEKFARIAESRYSVGKAQQQDVIRAQVEVSVLMQQMRKLNQQRETLKAEINALLGRPAAAPLPRPADYQRAELSFTLEDLAARAEKNSPLLKREQAMVQQSQAALQLARRDYYPDFAVMGGYYNSGSLPSMWEFRFEAKVPLYFWRKQRAAVEEQAANVAAARYQYQAAGQDIGFGIKEAYEAARTSEELLMLYSRGILPQSTLALESALASYQVGTVDFLTLLTGFRSVLDYEMSYYEEQAAFQKALARLEELTGASLT